MNDIPNIIPPKFRQFLVIAHYDLPPEFSSIPLAIKEALETIGPNIRINKKYKIFVGKFPFKIPVPPDNGYFIFSASDEYVCAVFDDYIFLDYSQISIYPFPVQVAHILEEFVHALMNVTDEVLAKSIVRYFLYPRIDIVDGKYQSASVPSQDSQDNSQPAAPPKRSKAKKNEKCS